MTKDLSDFRVVRGVAERYAHIPGGEITVSTIPPGTTVSSHHHAEAQIGFALEGELHMTVGLDCQRVDRSHGYFVGPGVLHRPRNEGVKPLRTLDLKLMLPGGGHPMAAGAPGASARPCEGAARPGFHELQFPFGFIRHRLLEQGESLLLDPPATGASYIAEVPVLHSEEARIVSFKAPHRVEAASASAHVVEVSFLHDAKLVTECSRFEWLGELQHGTVLVIEESDAARRALVAQFETAGFRTFEASACCPGVRLAAEQYPEIILLDVDLASPFRIDEALACLASGIPLTKIVAMTARGSLANASSLIQRGATAYLPKPTTAHLMLASLRQSVEYGSARGGRPFTLSRASWEYLQQVVEGTRSRAEAARRLGIQPRSLRRMLSKNAPPQ